MSSIDKLLVRGIRSFSPHADSTIEFYSPLTIIVGPNGAGKTTIIECLKFATSGELPPNAKGGAFVHDPKLCHESEVKGQIKLRFKNARGQTMVCTRTLQTTRARSRKLTQKSLESCLSSVDPETSEVTSMSSRVAEMDAELPVQLGVSRAVLENVIFCHQEDSFWPLSEPAVLKRKFDEIFAATKYTRALENLRSLRKEMAAEIKVEQQRLEHLRSEFERAQRISMDAEAADAQLSEARTAIATLNEDIAESTRAVEAFSGRLRVLAEADAQIALLEHKLVAEARMIDQLRTDLAQNVSSVDDDELARLLYAAINTCSTAFDDTEAAIVQLEGQRKELSTRQTQLLADIRVVEQRSERYAFLQSRLEADCVALSKLLSIYSDSDKLNWAGLYTRCTNEIDRLATNLHEMQVSASSEDRAFQSKLENLSCQHSAAAEQLRLRTSAVEDAQRRLADVQHALAQIPTLDGALLAQLQATISRCEEEHTDALQSQKLQFTSDRRYAFFAALQSAEERRDKLAVHTAAMERISALYLQARSEEEKYSAMAQTLSEMRAKIKTDSADMPVTLPCLPMLYTDTLEETVDAISAVAQALAVKEQQVQIEAAAEMSKVAQIESLTASISRKRRSLETLHTELVSSAGLESQNLSDALQEFARLTTAAQEDEKRLTKEASAALSGSAVYVLFEQKFLQTKDCPLCERGFAHESEQTTFASRLSGLIRDLPKHTLQLESQRRAAESKCIALQKLRPSAETAQRLLSTDIPEAEQQLHNLTTALDSQRNALFNLRDDVNALTETKAWLDDLRQQYTAFIELSAECDAVKQSMTAAQSRVADEAKMCGVDVNLLSESNVARMKGELEACVLHVQQCAASLAEFDAHARDADERIRSADAALRDAREALLRAQLSQSDAIRLEQQRSELESVVASSADVPLLEEAIAQIQNKMAAVREEWDIARSLRQSEESSARKTLDAARDLMRTCQGHADELQNSTLDESVKERLSSYLSETVASLQKIETQLEKARSAAEGARRTAAEHATRERVLRDNVRLRGLERSVSSIREDIAKAQTSTANRRQVEEQHRAAQSNLSAATERRAGLLGEARQLAEQVARLRSELAGPCAEAAAAHAKQFVRTAALHSAVDDLDRYARALDQAIVRYHGAKMAEVNRTIRELWATTYQGADIDAIEIRAETEAGGDEAGGLVAAAPPAPGARSYFYRVVMLKGGGDAELDMRGRSSAGQRVLASLVIRLALAETFGQHCGVLALDEPTTNLDRENIEGLAASLAEIIRLRGASSNFQLIVITHDEEFVELLGRHDCAEHYWRVSKNDAQHSTIRRESFCGSS